MSVITNIKTFAALGTGVIGSGWVARALAHGLDVVAWDPAPNAEEALRANVANAWPALETVGLKPGASQSRLKFVKTIEECVKDADFIQESAPERLEIKRELYQQLDAIAAQQYRKGAPMRAVRDAAGRPGSGRLFHRALT